MYTNLLKNYIIYGIYYARITLSVAYIYIYIYIYILYNITIVNI